MFLNNELMAVDDKYNIESIKPMTWDRQTLLILCPSSNIQDEVIRLFRTNRKPQSNTIGRGYKIDGFVNMDYKPNERDPANRNVRIIYCNMEIMTREEIYDRFPNSYIIKVEEKGGYDNATPRIGRELPQISRR